MRLESPMLKVILAGLGWFLMALAVLGLALRLFGSDEMVRMYAGSRNMDMSFGFVAIALVFLGISSILGKLDRLQTRDTPPD